MRPAGSDAMPDFEMPAGRALGAGAEGSAEPVAASDSPPPAPEPRDIDAGPQASRASEHRHGEAGAQAPRALPWLTRRSDPEPPPTVRRRRIGAMLARRRSPIVTFVGGMLAGAIVLGGVQLLNNVADQSAARSVESLADRYVAALMAGDVEAMNGMFMPDADQASTALLTNEVYEQTLPVASVTIGVMRRDGNRASVPLTLVVNGINSTAMLEFASDGGRWSMTSGLATMTWVEAPLARAATVNTHPVALDIDGRSEPLWLYPGDYNLGAETSTHVDVQGSWGIVTPSSHALNELLIWFKPSGEVQLAMQSLAGEFVQSCALALTEACPSVESVAGATYRVDATALNLGGWSQDTGGIQSVFAVSQTGPDGWETGRYRVLVRAEFANDAYQLEASVFEVSDVDSP